MKPVLCATAQVLGTKDIDAGEGARILVSFCVYYLLLCLCAHAMGMVFNSLSTLHGFCF